MDGMGIRFLRNAVPISITLNSEGRKVVLFKQGEDEIEDIFDTVLFAIGRGADTKGLNLAQVGVELGSNGKIIAGDDDRTSV
jgi:thioredoxin reductase (NADPH)